MDRCRGPALAPAARDRRPAAPARAREPVDGVTAEVAGLSHATARVRSQAALQAMASASPRVRGVVQRRAALVGGASGSGGEGSAGAGSLTCGGERGLPGSLAADMERSFATDFSAVRFHPNSGEAARLGADALTVDEHVHVAPGRLSTQTHAGRALIGHELAHVVQQRCGRVAPQVLYKGVGLNADRGLEREADVAGERAARGQSAGMGAGAGGVGRGGAVQAKLGFELEMLVLVDRGGRPIPEKTQIGSYGPHLTFDVDQAGAVDSPTPTAAHTVGHDLPQSADLTKRWYHAASEEVYDTEADADAAHPGLAGVTEFYIDPFDQRELDPNEVDWTLRYRHTASNVVYATRAAALAAHAGLAGVVPEFVDGGGQAGAHPLGPGMGNDRYASILEVVTAAYAPETQFGAAQILLAMRDAVEFANALEARGYRNTRGRLDQVHNKVRTISNDIYVGHPNQPAQTTDASIQTTVGVDLAQIPSLIQNIVGMGAQAPFLLKHDADTVDPFGRYQPRAQLELGLAKRDATQIINHIGHGYGGGQNSTLVNMRGLLTLICQYLRMGRYAYTGGSWVLDKNITPFLSRTNLSHIRQNQLGAQEQAWLTQHVAAVRARILHETGRTAAATLYTDTTEAQNNPPHGVQLTVQTFINNVLTQADDGVTSQLGGMKLIGAEDVDPGRARSAADAPRLGPVFEVRNEIPKNEDDGERFPRGDWVKLANYWLNLIRTLNARSEADATRDARLRFDEDLDTERVFQDPAW